MKSFLIIRKSNSFVLEPGFLYLGGGRLTLGTSPEAIAGLICACYPKFPTHSNDNRYHLQALRHLHVLATEPRLLVPTELPNMQVINQIQ